MTVKEIYELAMSGYIPEKKLSILTYYEMYGNPSPNAKAVRQYSSDGEFIAEYPSLGIASKVTGIADTTISRCLHGKFPYAGREHFVFRFVKDNN